jgi:recombination protein RecA
LDNALGIGGLPRSTVVEFLGHATSGKTTLALTFLAQAQAQAPSVWVGYVDPSNVFDPEYAHRCSLDLSRLVVGFPDDLTQTLTMVEALATGDGISAIVLDAGGWREGLDRRAPDATQRIATSLRRIVSGTRSEAVLIVLRDAAPGLSPLASVRLQIVRQRWIWQHRDVRGYEARIDVLKNRFGPPGRSAFVSFTFDATV